MLLWSGRTLLLSICIRIIAIQILIFSLAKLNSKSLFVSSSAHDEKAILHRGQSAHMHTCEDSVEFEPYKDSFQTAVHAYAFMCFGIAN